MSETALPTGTNKVRDWLVTFKAKGRDVCPTCDGAKWVPGEYPGCRAFRCPDCAGGGIEDDTEPPEQAD